MKVIKTEIEGLKILEPDYHRDGRGYFVEAYNARRYKEIGIMADFVQDNESLSMKGVVRGLHWQAAPHTQAKLVRVVRGAVWDVAVDIRKGSVTYGRHVAVTLSAESGRQFFIPRGFAHGFIVLEDNTLFSYKCDDFYCPASECGMRFDDPELNINWPDIGMDVTLSEKDRKYPFLKDIQPYVVIV